MMYEGFALLGSLWLRYEMTETGTCIQSVEEMARQLRQVWRGSDWRVLELGLQVLGVHVQIRQVGHVGCE